MARSASELEKRVGLPLLPQSQLWPCLRILDGWCRIDLHRARRKTEDVAELAQFLCTERARHIQGAAIGVDGGQTTGLF